MPTLLSAEEIAIEWSDLAKWKHRKQPPMKRSSGIHLSGIIKALSVQTNLGDDPDEFPLRMAMGMAWENWMIGLLPNIKWQPGEWECDGVYGTPDGLEKDICHEFKLTWCSINKYKHPAENPRWKWQMAGNLYAQGLNSVAISINYTNGDYRPPSPKYIKYSYNYTDEELQLFWSNVVMKNKHLAIPEQHEK